MNFKEINERIEKSYLSVKKKANFSPKTAVILGSGLSSADSICENGIVINYKEIEGFPISTVEGHKGVLVINENIVVFVGRFHYYEGYHPKEVIMPVLLAKKLGVENLIVTNSAGAINSKFSVNDFILIKDHINFMGINPLIGSNDEILGTRFPEMTSVYGSNLMTYAREVHKDLLKKEMKEGVYLAVSGPSYETAAEIQFFKTIGADLVGMSTIPEMIMASYLNLNAVAVSNVTNMAAGLQKEALSHEEVKLNGEKTIKDFTKFLKGIIQKIGNN